MNPIILFLKRNVVSIILSMTLVGSFVAWQYTTKDVNQSLKSLTQKYQKLTAENESLKSRYTQLEADRDNVLTQTKILLKEKTKYISVQEMYDKLKTQHDALAELKAKNENEIQRLTTDLQDKSEKLEVLEMDHKDKVDQLNGLRSEHQVLSNAYKAKIENSPEYKKWMRELADVRKERNDLRNDTQRLGNQLKRLSADLKKSLERNLKIAKQNAKYQKELQALKIERKKLIEQDKQWKASVNELPQRFKDMATENKRLLRETAEMHYNLGVFYTQNRVYPMALKEFTRALEFNPNSPRIHYNLGYLYAEELGKHEQAMAHFKRYLELDPHSKESEIIRSYMLERQSFGDKADRVKLR